MCLRSEFSLIPFSDRAKQHNSKADSAALSGWILLGRTSVWTASPWGAAQERPCGCYTPVQRFTVPDFTQVLPAHKPGPWKWIHPVATALEQRRFPEEGEEGELGGLQQRELLAWLPSHPAQTTHTPAQQGISNAGSLPSEFVLTAEVLSLWTQGAEAICAHPHYTALSVLNNVQWTRLPGILHSISKGKECETKESHGSYTSPCIYHPPPSNNKTTLPVIWNHSQAPAKKAIFLRIPSSWGP